MRLVHLSDTHNLHNSITEFKETDIHTPLSGDIIIHSGDATNRGTIPEVNSFLTWYGQLKFTHKIFTPGNHDWLFQLQPQLAEQMCKDAGVILLHDSMADIDGLKIYGSGWQPAFNNWAFNSTADELLEHWKKIPENIDVLVTHSPPYGILDRTAYQHVGCRHLLDKVLEVMPKVHLFGHLHMDYGMKEFHSIHFYNSCLLDDRYTLCREPVVIDLP